MKKTLLCLLFSMFFISTVFADKVNPMIEIFKSDKPLELIWYLIKDNSLYIHIGYDSTGESEIFKYNNKLTEVVMDEDEKKDFTEKYDIGMIANPENNKSNLGNGNLLFVKYTEKMNVFSMSIIDENSKEKDISKGRYYLFAFNSYIYIDIMYQKIYLTLKDENNNKIGLYIYDIKSDTFQEMYVNKEKIYYKNIRYSNPIRVPNTPYLMYRGVKDRNNWGLYIEEIPEWKAEIEAKEKTGNKGTEEVKAKESKSADIKERYVIDGPANIRDNYKKGKTIATIENAEKITIIDKKGSWYQISYKDIIGWTFKDNIKKVN